MSWQTPTTSPSTSATSTAPPLLVGDVAQRRTVRPGIEGVLGARRPAGHRSQHEQLHNAAEVGLGGGSDHRTVLRHVESSGHCDAGAVSVNALALPQGNGERGQSRRRSRRGVHEQFGRECASTTG